MKSVRLIITGRVQGVGYRDWLVAEATALGLSGWVRNLTDGSVEAFIAGAANAVEQCAKACRHGPPAARTVEIIQFPADSPTKSGFRRLPTATRSN